MSKFTETTLSVSLDEGSKLINQSFDGEIVGASNGFGLDFSIKWIGRYAVEKTGLGHQMRTTCKFENKTGGCT